MLHNRSAWTLMLVLLVPLFACELNTRGDDDVVLDTMAVDRDTLLIRTPEQVGTARTQVQQVRERWRSAWEADDVAGVSALYTDNAVLVGPFNSISRGRQEIQDSLRTQLPMLSNVEVTPVEFDASGRLAYEYGQWRQRVTPPQGQALTTTGSYITVLERQQDGRWLITRQVATANLPEGVTLPGMQRAPAAGQTGAQARPRADTARTQQQQRPARDTARRMQDGPAPDTATP